MTVQEFDRGYWYATEIKRFADSISIPSAGKLRKDELERAIRLFLKTGTARIPTTRNLSATGPKDVEKGLRPSLRIVNYTNDKTTKDFLEAESRKLAPDLKRKSGSRYRLNRWREEQLMKGIPITYRDLVAQYVKLNQTEGSFRRIPVGRYINFVADFLANEKQPTRAKAIAAWKELKHLPIEKTYRAWTHYRVKIGGL